MGNEEYLETKRRMESKLGMVSKFVDIGTHKLCLYSNRPFEDQNDASPAVLLLSGLGCSSLGWAGLIRILTTSVRIYTYDRSGYGSSQRSPLPCSAENIAKEMDLLIKKAGIEQKLIIVAHSWAGIFGREYILRAGTSQIAGLVLIDANQERTLQVHDWRDPNIWAIAKGVDYWDGKRIREEHKLTDEEFALVEDESAQPHHVAVCDREMAEYGASFPTLAAKNALRRDPPLLGDIHLCVVIGRPARDFQGLYDAGVAKGNGTEEQRQILKKMIEPWNDEEEALQRETLVLSTRSKVIIADDCGHHIELTGPAYIAEAVKWCLQENSHSV